jgi:hypothetical protein
MGPFISPGEATLMDATARLAAVQTLMKEMQRFQASMELDRLDTNKHLAWMDAKLWEFQKAIDRLWPGPDVPPGATPTHPNPDSSGGSE